MRTTIRCPLCGTKNQIETSNDPVSHYCDSEVGGCEQLFLYKTKVVTTVEVTSYKLPLAETTTVEMLVRGAS